MAFKQKPAVVVVAVQQSYWGKQWQHVRTNLYDRLWSTHFQHLTATLASIVKRQPHDLSKLRKLATTTYRDGSSQLLDRSKLYVETNMQDFSSITNSTVNRPTIFMSLLIHCDHLFCQSACFSGGSIFWTFGSLSSHCSTNYLKYSCFLHSFISNPGFFLKASQNSVVSISF